MCMFVHKMQKSMPRPNYVLAAQTETKRNNITSEKRCATGLMYKQFEMNMKILMGAGVLQC